MGRDFFEVLGITRQYHLPADQLEQRYKELSKQVHPDRFAKAAPRERLAAVQKTTELNDAWRVLRDPVKRAEYLLKLEGLDVADEKSASVKADPALLMEMMEKNEQLHEAKALGDTAQIVALEESVRAARVAALESVHEGFTLYDDGDRSSLPAIAQALVALRYHARFLEQIEAWQEGKELGV
jgi:molecular chaperone HscB